MPVKMITPMLQEVKASLIEKIQIQLTYRRRKCLLYYSKGSWTWNF